MSTHHRTGRAATPSGRTPRTIPAAGRPWSWRGIDLITAAMLAVAFGVVFWGFDTFVYPAVSAATTAFPPLGALTLGVWLVPAVVGALNPDEDPAEARVGPVPRPMIEAAHRASEEAARELLSARRDAARERLQEHATAEEERLVVSAFQGGAARETVDAALGALRAHRAAIEDALRRVRLELDAAAVVLPS